MKISFTLMKVGDVINMGATRLANRIAYTTEIIVV